MGGLGFKRWSTTGIFYIWLFLKYILQMNHFLMIYISNSWLAKVKVFPCPKRFQSSSVTKFTRSQLLGTEVAFLFLFPLTKCNHFCKKQNWKKDLIIRTQYIHIHVCMYLLHVQFYHFGITVICRVTVNCIYAIEKSQEYTWLVWKPFNVVICSL